MAMIKTSSRRGLVQLVEGLGGDSAGLLARFDLSPELLDADDAYIPADTAARLLEAAATEVGCLDLGLRLAEQRDFRILGPLAVAVKHAATIRDGLASSSRFLFTYSQALSITAEPDHEGQAGVAAIVYRNSEHNAPQAMDLGLGFLHRILVLLNGGSYGLRTVYLPHPPLVEVSRYTGFFGADVRFGRDVTALRVPSTFLDTPLPHRDEILATIATDYLVNHFGEPGQTVTAQVRRVLRRSLGTAPPRIDVVARSMSTHPRTLQRQLAAEGTTFDAVLDGSRRDAAHHLLTETGLPMSRIARMIGFSEQSTLTRASRRWFGEAPREVRRRSSASATTGR